MHSLLTCRLVCNKVSNVVDCRIVGEMWEDLVHSPRQYHTKHDITENPIKDVEAGAES